MGLPTERLFSFAEERSVATGGPFAASAQTVAQVLTHVLDHREGVKGELPRVLRLMEYVRAIETPGGREEGVGAAGEAGAGQEILDEDAPNHAGKTAAGPQLFHKHPEVLELYICLL